MRFRILRTGETDTARVEAFSDGVLAIVITLLILDVQIPRGVLGGNSALWRELIAQLPMIGAWVLSFFFVLVFWVSHHYFFKRQERVDRGLRIGRNRRPVSSWQRGVVAPDRVERSRPFRNYGF